MRMRTLGRTGVKVSPLCLGAMMFGSWGNPDHDESIRIIHRALDSGINFIDTADVYSRRWITREVENSLRRLGTDWIDLYQIHRPELDTDIDETLGALSDLIHAG